MPNIKNENFLNVAGIYEKNHKRSKINLRVYCFGAKRKCSVY